MQKEMKTIHWYKFVYLIDIQGNVYKKTSSWYIQLKAKKNSDRNFLRVCLMKKKQKSNTELKISDIVYTYFVWEIKKWYTTAYRDGNMYNMKPQNLYLVSKTKPRPKRVAQIESWKVIDQFLSLKEAQIKTNICYINILRVCKWQRKTAWWYQRKYI